MEIRLRSTVGGFSPDFMRKLPELEKAMLAHGLEPSEFLISKDRASPGAPWITPFFYLSLVCAVLIGFVFWRYRRPAQP